MVHGTWAYGAYMVYTGLQFKHPPEVKETIVQHHGRSFGKGSDIKDKKVYNPGLIYIYIEGSLGLYFGFIRLFGDMGLGRKGSSNLSSQMNTKPYIKKLHKSRGRLGADISRNIGHKENLLPSIAQKMRGPPYKA